MINYNYNNLSKREKNQLSKVVNDNFNKSDLLENKIDDIVIGCMDQLRYAEANINREYRVTPEEVNRVKRLVTMGEELIDNTQILVNQNNKRKKKMFYQFNNIMTLHKKKNYTRESIEIMDKNIEYVKTITKDFEAMTISIKEINQQFYKYLFARTTELDINTIINENMAIVKGLVPKVIEELKKTQSKTDKIRKNVLFFNDMFIDIRKKVLSVKDTDYYVKIDSADCEELEKVPRIMKMIEEEASETNNLLSKINSYTTHINKIYKKGLVLKEIEPFTNKMVARKPLMDKDLIQLMEFSNKINRLNNYIKELNQDRESIYNLWDNISKNVNFVDKTIDSLDKHEKDYRKIYK